MQAQVAIASTDNDEERVRAAFCQIADVRRGNWYELDQVDGRWRVRSLGKVKHTWWATIRGESITFDKER